MYGYGRCIRRFNFYLKLDSYVNIHADVKAYNIHFLLSFLKLATVLTVQLCAILRVFMVEFVLTQMFVTADTGGLEVDVKIVSSADICKAVTMQ